MDWGYLFSAVMPTIGQVVGSLIGVKSIEDGILRFFHSMVKNTQQNFSSLIYYDSELDSYILFNQSPRPQDIVTLSFPQKGGQPTPTLLVPCRQSVILSQLFRAEALEDNSQFILTASSMPPKLGYEGQLQGCILTEASSQICVGGTQQHLGSYLDVEIQPKQIILTSCDHRLCLMEAHALRVQNSGDTGLRFSGIKAQAGQVVVSLPQPLRSGQPASIEVVAQMQSAVKLEQLVAHDLHAHVRIKTDKDTIARLEKAPKLNWR